MTSRLKDDPRRRAALLGVELIPGIECHDVQLEILG
jgi:hypothetical protein